MPARATAKQETTENLQHFQVVSLMYCIFNFKHCFVSSTFGICNVPHLSQLHRPKNELAVCMEMKIVFMLLKGVA